MTATPADMDLDDDTDKAIVRSVRFKPEQWKTVSDYCSTHRVRHGSFLRNAALKAAGGATEIDSMRALANSLEGALQPTAAEPAPARKAAAAKPKTKKRRR